MVVLMRLALIVALAVLPAAGLSPSLVSLPPAQDSPARDVDVAAERFSFTPSEIRITTGTTLRIRLQSDDTAHGFHIVGTGVDLEIPKRGRGATTVMFTPEQAGRYTFECSRLCGAGHSFMRGVIIVTDPPETRQ
jgi:cytochrome c oxidase subunit 2